MGSTYQWLWLTASSRDLRSEQNKPQNRQQSRNLLPCTAFSGPLWLAPPWSGQWCIPLPPHAQELWAGGVTMSVLLLGWCWGERLRDGERGWFPQSCARQITNPTAVEGNVRRMERLRRETDV